MKASLFAQLPWCVVLGLAFTLAASPAKAAIMRDDVPSSEYEAFFKDPMFQSVGWFAGSNANGLAVAGSGVLIAPDWVLTAGHVIDSPSRGMYEDMWFSLSDSIYGEAPNYVAADALYLYPGFVNDGIVGNNVDLGLVHLSTPVTGVTPAERFRGEDQRGTLMYTAGFGIPGLGSGTLLADDGIGRAGNVIAETFGGDVHASTFEPQYWNARMYYPGLPGVQPLEWLSSPGDSGGGWFADVFGTGEMQLVGINSFVKGSLGYGSDSGALRVSLYNDWIDTTIAQNSVPEPSSLACMLTIGLLAAGLRLRSFCFQGGDS